MGMIKVAAWKCEWCGRLFEHEYNSHDIECMYDPKAQTCVSCMFSGELKAEYDAKEATRNVRYCPRSDTVFSYPHAKYCPDYKKAPEFESYAKQGGAT